MWKNKPLGGLTLLVGMAMVLAYAPFGLWFLGAASLAWLYVLVVRAAGWRQLVGACALWGFGWQIACLHWLPRSFYIDAGRDVGAAVFGGIPALVVVCIWGLAGVVVAGAATYKVKNHAGRGGVFISIWLGVEVVRSLSPFGFPWLLLGAAVSGWPVLAQAAAGPWGVFGLSFMVLALAVLGAEGVMAGRGKHQKVWYGAALGLFVVWSGFGVWRLAGAPAVSASQGALLRLVQPNIQDPLKWDIEARWGFVAQTADMMKTPGWPLVDAFILPENALPLDVERETAAVDMLRHGLGKNQQVVAGTVGRDEQKDGSWQYTNRIVVLGENGVESQSDKVLLVPFGEYIPLRSLIMVLPLPAPLKTFLQGRTDYTAAQAPALLTIGGQKALPLVCYEGIFMPYVKQHAQNADFLLNLTSDMWFTGTIALSQHAALARLRAIENHMPLVRVATTGITVVYDAYGREVFKLSTDQIITADYQLKN
ncbi:MAG: apolipoprotein N-acyltransferase [Alphaproteobacteria bacterium CG_4_10_14_0_8_um_filter_53_9]|nr:MAG: apolipoprotein N-acyltransferase [Alphaproteobacteria bacterium CG_4_10_14_0_8_um_filter_53_9]